ncbi:Nramp family divalent metal transporter [Candidatus Dojkabacteria bacterium]|uniref:Nramp family divalent metal transporter n=1 Tax=Candidatus Dojkabacteria bacterium TaxID=2099670 RepID=A0A955KVK1_9BACT|nr:Nramp family divalent metal transporter [Candidatus Dojkabacteria bacterium]MCB9790995.1 Nramp family divalent metal transporter [Candidatus Nomurabacteria bacterium]
MTTKFPKSTNNFWKTLGPSLTTIGLGLGSGEFILWPFLTAHYGFGILWGALIGITLQLFLILEIQRYTVVKGENIIRGFQRITKYTLGWITLSTLIGWLWPGFAATSALLLLKGFSLNESLLPYLSCMLLILSGFVLLTGKQVYKKVESIQKTFFPTSFIIILVIFLSLLDLSELRLALKGIIGIGDGYNWLPKDLKLSVFLSAFAYAGSGGNMLLGQSFYAIEKSQGLAKFAKKFILWGEKQKEPDREINPSEDQVSITNFQNLRKQQVAESSIVFWGMGFITIFMLAYISKVLLSDQANLPEGFQFLITEANALGINISNIIRILFLCIGIISLVNVQVGVLDLIGRVFGIAAVQSKKFKAYDHNRVYAYTVVATVLIGLAILIFGGKEPSWLIVTGAILNSIAMAVLGAMTIWTNNKFLPRKYRPNILISIILFTGVISYIGLFLATIL